MYTTYKISGVKLNYFTKASFRNFLDNLDLFHGQIVFMNSRSWYFYKNHSVLFNEHDTIVFPDGAPLRWLATDVTSFEEKAARISGLIFFKSVMQVNQLASQRHMFIGTTPETLSKLQKNVEKDFPSANIVSMIAPSFGSAEDIFDSEMRCEIKKAKPDFIWVGLGAPKQDIFSKLVLSEFGSTKVIGVGLVFDYLSGNVKRPPDFINFLGIEWLYRIFKQPTRTVNFVKPFFAILKVLIWKKLIKL